MDCGPRALGFCPAAIPGSTLARLLSSPPPASRGLIDDNGKIKSEGAGQQMYALAREYNVTGNQLDEAMGWSPGDADAWIEEHGLDPLRGSYGPA